MVNDFIRGQVPTKCGLHDQTMLPDVPSFGGIGMGGYQDQDVPALVYPLATLPCGVSFAVWGAGRTESATSP